MIRFLPLSFLCFWTTNIVLSSFVFCWASDTTRITKEWKVIHPPEGTKEVSFTLSEGTWMNLDVSPDGQHIVFDLLGDIYELPISGGTAKVLRQGLAWEVQPRYSPDGKQILFTSDAGGGDNEWVMQADGSNPKSVTTEDFRLLNNGVWMPNGNYIVARKHYTGYRSLGAGEMWMYHINGGSGIQLTKRKNDQMDVNEPSVSPDGRYLYFTEDMSPGNYFEYNKDPNGQIYVLRRYDFNTGQIENLTGGSGSALRPQVSHSGKQVAFVRRVRGQSVLWIYQTETGEEYPLYDNLSKDQQETWATFGTYPGFAWSPQDDYIFIWAKGKIQKINVKEGTSSQVPFTCEVKQQYISPVTPEQVVGTDSFEVKMIRNPITSPDGKMIVFHGAGYLWKKTLPNGVPVRLTQGTDFEFFPDFSSSGKEIVFVTWNDTSLATVCVISVEGKDLRKLNHPKGYYVTPRFDSEGKRVVVSKVGGDILLGQAFENQLGIYQVYRDGQPAQRLLDHGSKPRYSRDGKSIYYFGGEGDKKVLKELTLLDRSERTLCSSKYATEIIPSPDNQWIAFQELFQIYIAAFPASGQTLDLSSGNNAVPMFKVTREGGTFLHWSNDSKTLHWMVGPEYFSRSIQTVFKFIPGAPDSIPGPDTLGIRMGLSLKTAKANGTYALMNARIITLKDSQVIENGIIIIENNRISSVGDAKTVRLPGNLQKINLEGKTIIPGLIDVHSHMPVSYSGLAPQQVWPYDANLAFGVTTTHDPSNLTEMVFNHAEMQKAGYMRGPRLFSTGTILYGAEGDFKAVIQNYEDALNHLRRMKAVGAISVKSYNQPRRNQRQMVLTAARQLGMRVVPEGGSFFFHNLTMIADGHTGIEHSLPVNPVYQDVVQFWKNTDVQYTPTLIVGYGGIWGENYWYDKNQVWQHERLLKFTPRSLIDARSRRRVKAPDEEYGHFDNAATCKKLADAGVRVNLGAHGQLQGLGVHWELWMLVQGGMTPYQALQAATLNGARYLGMDKELGSIESGKLADLVILDQNPLENIYNSEKVHAVILNGKWYEGATLKSPGMPDPYSYYFQRGGGKAFPWGHYHNAGGSKCGCHVEP
jgi:imidazolonepropionase-like amidohydrolase/Tol biopolymer transport system component